MSRRGAQIALALVVAVFLIGVLDVTVVVAERSAVPEALLGLAGVVLSGVAVAMIAAGLRRNGHGSEAEPENERKD